ncbi:MAG TPA: hypothetical protein VFV64_07000 [Permianibacter sp.]|nr:hypothetical protein [Permianibacter sp.]
MTGLKPRLAETEKRIVACQLTRQAKGRILRLLAAGCLLFEPAGQTGISQLRSR